MLKARKNSIINFQECIGAWVRQFRVVSPSGMASHNPRLRANLFGCRGGFSFWERCVGSGPLSGVVLGSCKVGSSDVLRFPTALTTSSIESVASAFRKMQFDRSIMVHVRELGVVLRSACSIPFGIDLFR